MMLPENLKKRSFMSFTIFLAGILLVASGWALLRNLSPDEDDTATPPFRAALELNGKIWQSLFSAQRMNDGAAPTPSKPPRVNGELGLDDPPDLDNWSLEIIADDQDPKSPHYNLTLADLKNLPHNNGQAEFRCIEGWSENMSYSGIKFSDLMEAYHLPHLPYVGLETPDGEYYVSIDLESMLHSQTFLADQMNGEPLKEDNGAPLRLMIPVKYGIKNIKRVGKIFLSNRRPPDYWAERGYDWYAGL